jgi:hypothetical protein
MARHIRAQGSSPFPVKERMKHEVEYDLENPKRKKLIAEAEAVYDRLTIRCANELLGK